MSPAVVLPSDIFPIIARHCHPVDARNIQRLNKEISSVITTNDLVWGEARWRWSQSTWKCWEWAVSKGHVDVVRWCLELGRFVHDDVHIVKLLLEKGVDQHARRDDALVRAAEGGHLDVVCLLLEKGADVHAEGDEALRLAAEYGHLEVIRLLLEKDNGHLDVVRLLLEKGADVQADKALDWPAMKGHVEVVRLLLEKGADVHTHGEEALHLAAANGHLDVVRLLLQKGADVHARRDEALRSAVKKGHVEVARLLLENGAEVDVGGDEALRLAAAKGTRGGSPSVAKQSCECACSTKGLIN
ncbi:hypothetical protein HK104_009745 [Borealophlyctis nickersoniae]|nr:hypothetical protein HK104_009745 [Borealophlyctis nickersoniae]